MAALGASLILAFGTTGAAAGTSVLFIGNSFTFGSGSPVRFYRADTVTDLNDEGIGGVPALFKSFTQQAGLDYDVSLETRGGVGLDFHLANKLERDRQPRLGHGRDARLQHARRRQAARSGQARSPRASRWRTSCARRNPKVELYLMATWSRADRDLSGEGRLGRPADRGDGPRRARRLRQGRRATAGAKAVIPVGEAWTRAIQTGVADRNPYDGIEAGKLNLWTYDHYHASTYGYYLEALVIFGSVTGRDPRSLGDERVLGVRARAVAARRPRRCSRSPSTSSPAPAR